MRQTFYITTDVRETPIDITSQIVEIVSQSSIPEGIVSVYAQGATGAIMIKEN